MSGITITGISGRASRNRGNISRPSPSGITTSVITRSPSPALAQRHKVETLAVVRTAYPIRPNALLRTVRIERSSSAIRMVALSLIGRPAVGRIRCAIMVGRLARRGWQTHAKFGASASGFEVDQTAVVFDDLGDKR